MVSNGEIWVNLNCPQTSFIGQILAVVVQTVCKLQFTIILHKFIDKYM